MLKSTLFIAVKCYECTTMQVKQQKKSSNKWICVVCNQKQSVSRIYAQGYQAKHIRNVVQSLNMSRKFQDDQLPCLNDEGVQEVSDNSMGKRRTDWNFAGKQVVDESSEDFMFKKPKFKPNFSKGGGGSSSTKEIKQGSSCIVDDSDPIRDVSRRQCRQRGQQQQQNNKAFPPNKTGTSKRNQYKSNFDAHSELQKQQQPSKPMPTSASKWSKYMEQERDSDGVGAGDKQLRASAFADDMRFMCGYIPENDDVDQLIEEEIHPEFI